jgi:hypothetical protein
VLHGTGVAIDERDLEVRYSFVPTAPVVRKDARGYDVPTVDALAFIAADIEGFLEKAPPRRDGSTLASIVEGIALAAATGVQQKETTVTLPKSVAEAFTAKLAT